MKVATERWSSDLSNWDPLVFLLILLSLPTQVGLHFWPDFSFVSGVRVDYLSPTLYLTDILIIALFLVCFLNKKINFKINIYFLFFYCLLLLGALLSKNIPAAIFGIIKLSEFIFLGFYVYKNVRVSRTFLNVLSLDLIFESLLGILQFLNHASIGGIFYYFGERTFSSTTPGIANASINGALILRPYATFPHPNVLAAFLLTGITFLFFFAKTKTRLEKYFFAVTIIISSACLILTLGRVAILGFGFLILFRLTEALKNKSKHGVVLICGLIIVCFAVLLPYLGRFNLRLTDESVMQRETVAKASLKMIENHPLFGVGINNFLIELPNYTRSAGYFYLQPVHNIFLLAFSQIGLIAGLMFITLLIFAFRSANIRLKFMLFLVCFLGLFDHYFLTLQQAQIIFSLVLGLSFTKQNPSNLIK